MHEPHGLELSRATGGSQLRPIRRQLVPLSTVQQRLNGVRG